jgi:hypothetical protein
MRFSLTCIAVAALAGVVSAPTASAQTTAPTQDPVAHIFKFTPKTVTTTGAPPQALVRIDQVGSETFKLRVVLTSTKRVHGKRKKITVNLGTVPAGEVTVPLWPANKKLVKGTYNARLTATGSDGSKLTRPAGSRGTTTLKVIRGKATIASIPGVAGRMVALAEGEVGQTESPKGSNNSPRIATYRSATPGGPIGAWCAYFVSWLARTAGEPLGASGQGFGRVDDLYAWAKSVGKAVPATGVPIQPGDFMVWDEHIGIVETINADGSYTTIDGNYGDAVTRRVLTPAARAPVLGYVRL